MKRKLTPADRLQRMVRALDEIEEHLTALGPNAIQPPDALVARITEARKLVHVHASAMREARIAIQVALGARSVDWGSPSTLGSMLRQAAGLGDRP